MLYKVQTGFLDVNAHFRLENKTNDGILQGRALAAEMVRMREEARIAADRLESLVREREAERKQLLETQAGLSDALSHLESVTIEAQVLSSHASSAISTTAFPSSSRPCKPHFLILPPGFSWIVLKFGTCACWGFRAQRS